MSWSIAALALAATTTSTPAPTPTASQSSAPPQKAPVIIFLIDNSASLPPLDPDEKRVAALERMFTFLPGQPYRLILFGAKREMSVDDVNQYTNRGQWTDFYYAFATAREMTLSYPAGTEFRVVLLTDGLLDPDLEEWRDDRAAPTDREGLRLYVARKTIELVAQMKHPLYVILVGDVPKEGVVQGDREQSPSLVIDMVRAANGAKASALAQSLASFLKDDGVLLRKFVYRVAPHEGLKKVEPVIRRIVAPPRPAAEFQFLSYLVLPLVLFLLLLLGILVRSFPGPGDLEIVELALGLPIHVAADRMHKVEGGWATTGLCLVATAKDAHATFTYQAPSVDLIGTGLDTQGLDELTRTLLPMGLEDLRHALERYSDTGTKEEKIYALNLDYMAKNFDPRDAEKLLTTSPLERRKVPTLDFLRAKAHLLSNDDLRRKLIEPRLQMSSYGKDAERKELSVGASARIGKYGFRVKELARGGRKDVRLVLYYDRVPSLLGLKTVLPDVFQRVFRFRRSTHRIVS